MSNGIPTMRGMNLSGLTPGDKFLSLLQGQTAGYRRPAATTARGNVVPVLPGTPPYARQATKPAMPLEQAVMAQSMAQPKTSAPMTKLQRDLAMKMGLTGATQQQKAPSGGIMGMLPGLGTPGGAGLSAAAARGLQLSGYQDRPITTGEVLGEMMGAGMKAYQEQKRTDLADRIAMAKLTQPSEFEKKLALAGIDPTSAEGQELIRKMLTKPDTSISLGSGEREKIFLKSAMEDRTKERELSAVDPKVEVRLDQAIALLEGGLPTGGLEGGFLPFKQIAAGMGLLSDENLQELSEQEALNAFANQLVPMQRVAGSGSTSDSDMALYKSTIFGLDKTPYANLVIAKTMKQINRHNKARLSLLDKYIEKNGTTLGFGDYADSVLPRIFQRVNNVEDLQRLYESDKVREGDVYYHNGFNKFMFVEFE